MIPELVAVLRGADPDITDKDIADALWLALQIRKAVGRPEPDEIKPSDDRVTPPEAANKLLAKDKTSPLPEPPPSKRPARTPNPIPQSPRSGLYPGGLSRNLRGELGIELENARVPGGILYRVKRDLLCGRHKCPRPPGKRQVLRKNREVRYRLFGFG